MRLPLSVGLPVLCVAVLLVSQPPCVRAFKCGTQVGTCMCKLADGRTLDLRPLDAGGGDKPPRFTGYGFYLDKPRTFQYNPCTPLNCPVGDASRKTAICLQNWVVPPPILAVDSTAKFIDDDDPFSIVLRYTSDYSWMGHITSEVTFECRHREEGVFTVISANETGWNFWEFRVESKYACPDNVSPNSDDGGLSIGIGSIILIALGAIIVLYLIIGISLNIFVFKRSGIEIVPNYNVWTELGASIRDGCRFIYVLVTRKSSYQSV